MKMPPSSLELAISSSVTITGLILLFDGTENQSSSLLVAGAFSLTLGATVLAFAVRNALWHRQRLRDSTAAAEPDPD